MALCPGVEGKVKKVWGYCPNCKKCVPEEHCPPFCGDCGAAYVLRHETVCPWCGNDVLPSKNFCTKCGMKQLPLEERA